MPTWLAAVFYMLNTAGTFVGLLLWGSEGSISDTIASWWILWWVVPVTSLVWLLFRIVKIPAARDAEKSKQIEHLLLSRPRVELFIEKRNRAFWLEVRNQGKGADFYAHIDFSDTPFTRFRNVVLLAIWGDKHATAEHVHIPNAGKNHVLIMHEHDVDGSVVPRFRFIQNGTVNAIPPDQSSFDKSGIVTITISSKPDMLGGSKIVKFRYDGVDLSITEGEVRAIQSPQYTATEKQP